MTTGLLSLIAGTNNHQSQAIRKHLFEFIPSHFRTIQDFKPHQAAMFGHREIIRYHIQHKHFLPSCKCADEFARHGDLDFLQELRTYSINCTCSRCGANYAADNGHLHVLVYLRENTNTLPMPEGVYAAAKNGHSDVVKYCMMHMSRELKQVELANSLAASGQIELLSLAEVRPSEAGAYKAAANGHLAMVQHLHAIGIPFEDDAAAECAAGNGHLDVLKYLLEELDFGLWYQGVITASENGHLHILQYLWEESRANFEADVQEVVDCAAEEGHLHIVKYFYDRENLRVSQVSANIAAGDGMLEMIRYLQEEQGVECSSNGADMAAENGYMEVLRYLFDRGIYCTDEGADDLANHGRLDLIRELRQHGIHCTEDGADYAAEYGHLDIVQDLWEHGIHTTDYGADEAAGNGELAILQNLAVKGVTCSEEGACMAASNGHIHVIRFLLDSNLEVCTPWMALEAQREKHFDIVKLAAEYGIEPAYDSELEVEIDESAALFFYP